MGRLKVGVVFGGRSGEHEVSLRSARSVLDAMDRERFEAVPVGIGKDGRWLAEGDPLAALFGGSAAPSLVLPPAALLDELDVIFPVVHGPFGEDGTLQGLLEMVDLPYVGAGVSASAVSMDKVLFKDVVRSHGLPLVPDHSFTRRRWETQRELVVAELETELGYPVFTKPANLGSSVGISRCGDRTELEQGLDEAARYDSKLLVEKAVPAAREIEVSLLGNDDPKASVPGEIKPSREFYDYAAKYLDDGSQASELLIPAPLTGEQESRVRELALEAYRAVDCAGMARVDFLLNGDSGELYLNEINTIPGFTSISMYAKLWEATGLPYAQLITRLIELALERHADRQRNRTSFGSGAD